MSSTNSTIDINKARQETLATTSGLIHFNNAGSSLMPTPVSEALYDFLKKEELNPIIRCQKKELQTSEKYKNNFYENTI